MITDKPKLIKEYLLIDRMAEGSGWVRAKDGFELWGIPYGFVAENSLPYIEHRKNNKTIRTVNAIDVSIIDFAEVEE